MIMSYTKGFNKKQKIIKKLVTFLKQLTYNKSNECLT
jgi:hypothetical protein